MSEQVWFSSKEVAGLTGFSPAYIRDLVTRYKKIDKANHRKKGTKLYFKMPQAAFDMRANVQLGRNGPAVERKELTKYLADFPNAPPISAVKPPDKPRTAAKRTGNDAVSVHGFGSFTLNQAKEEQARQTAAALKMKNDKQAGKLVDKDEVERQAFECARLTRDTILNIPDRISAELASITDVHVIHDRLTSELIQALEGVADEL